MRRPLSVLLITAAVVVAASMAGPVGAASAGTWHRTTMPLTFADLAQSECFSRTLVLKAGTYDHFVYLNRPGWKSAKVGATDWFRVRETGSYKWSDCITYRAFKQRARDGRVFNSVIHTKTRVTGADGFRVVKSSPSFNSWSLGGDYTFGSWLNRTGPVSFE